MSTSTTAPSSRSGAARPRRRGCCRSRTRFALRLGPHERRGASGGLIAAAYLEGDFLLRSGKRSRYYLDKFRFETQPDLLAALGDRIAAAVREHEPDAARLAAPVLGAVPLAAAASLAGGLPFVIVRDEAKSLRHREPARRVLRGGRARLPRRGHRDLRRRAPRDDLGGPRGRPGRPNGRLRDRSRGGRSRRSRAPRRPSPAPFPGRRAARRGENPRKTAWLSRKHGVGRVVQAQQAIYDWRRE